MPHPTRRKTGLASDFQKQALARRGSAVERSQRTLIRLRIMQGVRSLALSTITSDGGQNESNTIGLSILAEASSHCYFGLPLTTGFGPTHLRRSQEVPIINPFPNPIPFTSKLPSIVSKTAIMSKKGLSMEEKKKKSEPSRITADQNA
jgi:hypothetical protein